MRVGSLFSGYGGLDMAVGGELAWYSEIEPAACRVMEAHHPGVPNIGDVTRVDWSEVEPVDVLTGGYPCQPFSSAGQRKGEQDERHLWPHVRDAISALGPRLTILENVRGHLTLGFADVLVDLADLGLSARWGVVRASDAGAPHGRARLFIIAYAESAEWRKQKSNYLDSGEWSAELGKRFGGRGDQTAKDLGYTHGSDEPPKQTRDRQRGQSKRTRGHDFKRDQTWGVYEPAIHRWERIIGRVAPTPTIEGNKRDKLNPVFVEWMMGLPEGWVTGHGLSASQELKMLGNGVVPQQARLALELL